MFYEGSDAIWDYLGITGAIYFTGAISVVEGCGDLGCEYMTGGSVTVLGEVGNNFGAGMTGGVAFVYDKSHRLDKNLNKSSVELVELSRADKTAISYFKKIIKDYVKETKSIKAKEILKNFENEISNIKLIKPINASMEDIKKNVINKVA